jgi:DNA-binding PadR family transcriptional regulator
MKRKPMTKKHALTQTGQTLLILEKSFGLTFAEVCTRLNETKEATRKALHYLHKEGRVARATDSNGVVHYNITDKGKEYLARELERHTDKACKAIEENFKGTVIKEEEKPELSAWDMLVIEAEQRGFAKGYSVGVQEAQRASYEQGRESVLAKLVGILR